MQQQELYRLPITRVVNPSVSTTQFGEETERVEIEEYVFTDEIINGLYRILNALRNNQFYNHIGIWIDGYYGSGKSHFLKYLDYCITPRTRQKALKGLMDAIREVDITDPDHNLDCTLYDMEQLADWLETATIDTCVFNLETFHDYNNEKHLAFLHIFWIQLNLLRGFNGYNLSLAQTLEKFLYEKGKFEAFKQRIKEEYEIDWNDGSETDSADLIDCELDHILDIAATLVPTLDKESMRTRIMNRDVNLSIERFAQELASFLKDKGDNYRLIFLADEVSQFINRQKDRYLNLQEIVTRLSETCGNKVWIACTAQQDLSQLINDCHILDEKDNAGKIMGRFEVKVSLKGTLSEYITRKRILDKKEEVKPVLSALYAENKDLYPINFPLPVSYTGYTNEEDFINYYPFLPYQFSLIKTVFNSFLTLGYVAQEVKGNERSLIKVVHATAKRLASQEVGNYASFDDFYINMFSEGLQAKGQRAIENALRVSKDYRDSPLAIRVTHVLFMICNIPTSDRLVFPATAEFITTLLMRDLSVNRLGFKTEVEDALNYLVRNNIARLIPGTQDRDPSYMLFSEEEQKIATIIKNTLPDENAKVNLYKEIIGNYITTLSNKAEWGGRLFNIGYSIKNTNYYGNTVDIYVKFEVDPYYEDPYKCAFHNKPDMLIYLMSSQIEKDNELSNDIDYYCKLMTYMQTTSASSDENLAIRKRFTLRGEEIKDQKIVLKLRSILDTCPIICGLQVFDEDGRDSKRGNERYKQAFDYLMRRIYTKSHWVAKLPNNPDDLRRHILRPVQPGDYTGLNSPMNEAENEVMSYLRTQHNIINVAEVVAHFGKSPFGWNNCCTLYVINELVRRQKYAFAYANNTHVEVAFIADNLCKETKKFTLQHSQVIPAELVSAFTRNWRQIYGSGARFNTHDPQYIYSQCHRESGEESLPYKQQETRNTGLTYTGYPFAHHFTDLVALYQELLAERDHVAFYQAFVDRADELREKVNRCRELEMFMTDQEKPYTDAYHFAQSNENNIQLVAEAMEQPIATLKQILTDDWPVEKLGDYQRALRQIQRALSEKSGQLKSAIQQNYEKAFADLEAIATNHGYPLDQLPDKEQLIAEATRSDEVIVLSSRVNVQPFYEQQLQTIMDYVTPEQTTDKEETTPTESKKTEVVKLKTTSYQPIRTQEDIDAYCTQLRKQIETYLTEHGSIMIY